MSSYTYYPLLLISSLYVHILPPYLSSSLTHNPPLLAFLHLLCSLTYILSLCSHPPSLFIFLPYLQSSIPRFLTLLANLLSSLLILYLHLFFILLSFYPALIFYFLILMFSFYPALIFYFLILMFSFCLTSYLTLSYNLMYPFSCIPKSSLFLFSFTPFLPYFFHPLLLPLIFISSSLMYPPRFFSLRTHVSCTAMLFFIQR